VIFQPHDWTDEEDRNPFPITEEHYDSSGIKHCFTITARESPAGCVVTATETNVESQGYEFNAFSPAGAYMALAAVRNKMRRTLAVKYLDNEHGHLVLTHDEMKGTIGYDSETGSHGVIVDGRFISMEKLESVLAQYEGWEFSLSIHDY
jgi:hypothetical protein